MNTSRPSNTFIAASWAALMTGVATYIFGLWNASIQLNEKGYYFVILMYGLFAAVSLQKSVRDKLHGIPVTALYLGLCWVSIGVALGLLVIGLWNASMANSEKGFYAIAYVLSLFAAIAVQKNTRDMSAGNQLQ